MILDNVGRHRRWLEYEREMHRRVLESLRSVPADRQADPAFAKAKSLLAHLLVARQIWLFRLGVGDPPTADFFPTGWSLGDLAERVEAVHAAWVAYLDRLDDVALARVFEYTSLDGQRFRNAVEDVLTQLFGHSSYHRGQIASLVAALGGKPAITDFIYWSREPVTPAVG